MDIKGRLRPLLNAAISRLIGTAAIKPPRPARDGALKDMVRYVDYGQRKNPRRNAQRKVKAEIGARQYRKQRKALARLAREQS
jgi:hypothetical protein